MPEFDYRAAQRDGSVTAGRIGGESEEAVLRQLRAQGMTPLQLTPASGGTAPAAPPAASRRGGARVSQDDVFAMTGELAVLLRAGLPLDRALKVLMGMSGKPTMTAVLDDLLGTVKGGKSLSQALRRHQALFGDFYINMVRSGEAGGHLVQVLLRLGEYLERAKALRSSVVSALIYPAILVTVAVLSVFVMLGFVVPQFETLFADMGEALPLPTRIVIGAGDAIAAYGWAGLLLLGLAIALGRRWLRTAAGREWRDRRLLALPLFGPLALKYELSRFARTMGTLLGSGVSMLESLAIATATVGNVHLRGALVDVPAAIKQGQRLGAALEASGVFTVMAVQMVQVGEESGRLDEMLLELARVHDDEVQTGVKRGLTLLEPILILGLGAVIAVIIMSIILGILSVNELAM